MQYRKLGRWGTRVSTVGLGSWLTYGGSVEADTARDCIYEAYDQGINFFDTANVYMRGRAEEVVGKALADFARDSYVLATKVFFAMGDGPNDRGLGRKHVTEQCHHSLRRLGVDYIDLYQCHRYDLHTPLEETCRVMDDLVRQGKILYWGTSEWNPDQITAAVGLCRSEGWAIPVSNQPQYSALWRRIEKRVLPTCDDLGVGNVVFAPLAMGILTGKYVSVDDVPPDSRAAGDDAQVMSAYFNQDVLDAVQKAEQIADGAGISLGHVALAWCLRQPAVSSVIVGATRPAQVSDNAKAADLRVPDDVMAQFDEFLAPYDAAPKY